MKIKPNVEGVTVKRVKDGFQVCGTVRLDVGGLGGQDIEQPVCVVVEDTAIRRALHDIGAEARRFGRRVASWFKRGKK